MYTLNSAQGKQAANKNVEFVNELRALYKVLCTGTHWVPGHSGNKWNERCDRLAKKGRKAAQEAKGIIYHSGGP